MSVTKKDLQDLVDFLNESLMLNLSIIYNSTTGEYGLVIDKNIVLYKGKIREVNAYLEGALFLKGLIE